MKNPFSRKKEKFPKSQEPRDLKDIQNEYNQLSAKAGQAQYNVYVHTKDLELINARLMAVNQEAHARNVLDKEAAKEAAKEVKEVKVEDKK